MINETTTIYGYRLISSTPMIGINVMRYPISNTIIATTIRRPTKKLPMLTKEFNPLYHPIIA